MASSPAMLAATSSADAALGVAVILVMLVGVIGVLVAIAGGHRRRWSAPRRRASPGQTIALGVILAVLGSIIGIFAGVEGVAAAKIAGLPRCSSFAASTQDCDITFETDVVGLYTYVTHGSRGGSTTHYAVNADVATDSGPVAASVEMESVSCWNALASGTSYPGLIWGRQLIQLTVAGVACRTTAHPGTQVVPAAVTALAFGAIGLFVIWSGVRTRRLMGRLGTYATWRPALQPAPLPAGPPPPMPTTEPPPGTEGGYLPPGWGTG